MEGIIDIFLQWNRVDGPGALEVGGENVRERDDDSGLRGIDHSRLSLHL